MDGCLNCLAIWPPLTVEAGEEPTAAVELTGVLGVFEHGDGTRHVTYDGQPLYYYVQDGEPGDTTGHEVGGVWFVAEPDSE